MHAQWLKQVQAVAEVDFTPDYTQYRREEIVQSLLKHACKSSHCMDKPLCVFGKTIDKEERDWQRK